MAFSGDEMADALSAAVGAHLIQEGDLREEIASNMSGKPATCLANNSTLQARSHFESKHDSEYSMQRYFTSPVNRPLYTDKEYSNSRPADDLINILPNRRFAHPAPDKQVEERFVYRDSQSSPYPLLHPGYFQKRQVEEYATTRDTHHLLQHPDPPVRIRRSRSQSPPFPLLPPHDWRRPGNPHPVEGQRRLEEFPARETTAYQHQVLERPPFPMHHDRPAQPHHSAVHRSKSSFHLLPAEHSEFSRKSSSRFPGRSSVNEKRFRKRYPRNTPSRVYSETTKKEEESFDDMLLDHRRHQKGIIENVVVISDSNHSNLAKDKASDVMFVENRPKPRPKEPVTEFRPQNNQPGHFDTTLNKPENSTSEMERMSYPIEEIRQPLLNQAGMLKPVVEGGLGSLNVNPHVTQIQQRQDYVKQLPDEGRECSGDNLQIHGEGDIGKEGLCDQTRLEDEVQDVDNYFDSSPLSSPLQGSYGEEVDDDDDEELLTLRSAALLSAYHRNVDIDKNDVGLVGDNSQEKEAENKVKKKTKQTKEKKHSKKATDLSRRSLDVRSESKDKVSKSKLRTSPSKVSIPLSPPLDPCDPSILTLGGVLKREKAKQEKALLQDIRKMNDPDVGVKIFMDLIKTKNERDGKMKKKKEESHPSTSSMNQSNSADNYDEVEMEVEDTNAPVDVAFKASPTYDIDSLTSDVEDSEPLCPPGTEEDHVTSSPSRTPTQEKIWDLLEKPLTSEPSSQQNLTAADMLIMSIRASSSIPVAEKVIKSLPEETIQEQTQPNLLVPQSDIPGRDNTEDVHVDSPYEFQHAFEATDDNDSYPAIATDLICATRDDMTSAALDADIPLLSSGRLSVKQVLVNPESTSPTTAPSQSPVQADAETTREARHSVDDENEEELREKLLKDLEQKRAAVKPVQRQVQKTRSTIELPPVKLGKAAGRKFANKFRMAKGNPKKIQIVQRKIKRALKYKRKRIRKRIRKQQKNEIQLSQSLLAKPGTESNDYDPFLKFSQSLPSHGKANAAPTNKSQLQSVVAKSKANPLKFKGQMGPPSGSGNGMWPTALPTRSQLTKVNTHPKRPLTPKSSPITTVAQVTSHPPVIINYQLSSDEDDRRVVLRSHPIQQDPQKDIVTTDNAVGDVAKVILAASSPAHDAASPTPTADDSSRKRKLFNGSSKEAKLVRPNSHPSQPSNVTHSTCVREVKINTPHTDQRKVVFSASPTTQAAVAQTADVEANKKLLEFESKLTTLRELLGRDKATISRMRQQKADLQTEMQRLRREADDLRNKLKENENGMAKATENFEKHKTKAREVVSKMEKRQKLQTKYLKEIEELKARQAALKPATISQLPNKTTSLVVKRVVDAATSVSDRIVEVEAGTSSKPHVAESKSTSKAKVTSELSVEQVAKQQAQSNRKRELEKSLLLEKSKALELEKEVLLRQAELKLSKQVRKRRVAMKPQRSSLSSIKARKNDVNAHVVSPKRDTIFVVNAINSHRQPVSSTSSNLDAKKTEKSSKVSSLQVTVVEPRVEICQNNERLATSAGADPVVDEGQNELTPVTPTLKKKRGDRRSSSSSVVTPTGPADCSYLTHMDTVQHESELPNLTAKECNDLKRRLQDKLTSKAANRPRYDNSQSSLLAHLFPVPTCFNNWAVDVGEIASRASDKKEGVRGVSTGSEYKSSLNNFRSYRLSSFFQSWQQSNVTSATFSHKIHADQILCRYDLNGKCQDSKCRAQHFKDLKLTPSEIYLDLLWYCPTLLKTKHGKEVLPSDDLDIQLKAADDTVARLCNTGGKADNAKRTVEETCIMLVNIINRALGNKDPHTTVLSRRRVRMQPTFDDDEEEKVADASPDSAKSSSFQDALNMEEFGGNASEVRYYDEDDNHRTRIEKLSFLLQQHPEDELMRIQLANAYLEHPKDDPLGHNKSIELALHTLCVGIESNELSERLWSAYVPVLRQHHNGETNNRNSELDIIDQILVLLPLSKPVWDEIFKWRWPFEKLDSYYEHLIENLVTRNAIWRAEDHNESASSRKYSSAYYSSWLLQTIAEQCHLLRQSGRRAEAKNFMSAILKAMTDIGKGEGEESEFPLILGDTVKLWLMYIHFIEFGKLPQSLYDHSLSSHKFGLVEGFGDITLPFTSTRKLVQKPENLRALFKDALQCLNNVSEDTSANTRCKFQLYRSQVKVEALLGNWDQISICCREILEDLSSLNKVNDQALDVEVWVVWVEAILQSKDPVLITQTFDSAITAYPRSAKLCYLAAVYQLNSDNKDIEGAMLYLECCIRSLIDLESDESLTLLEVHHYYRRLLKHDVSLQSSSHVQLREGITVSHVEGEKTYLWLIYCLLMDLIQTHEQETVYNHAKVTDLYEAALNVASSTEDRKIIWIQYLVYVRSTASTLDEATSTSGLRAMVATRRDRLAWLKRFTSLVRRCLATIPARYNDHSSEIDTTHTSYAFHNEVCSIFFSCFKKSQLPVAMTIMTDTMPTNLPLLSKAAFYFLRNEDYVSVSSLLWRVTSSYSGSNESCKDHKLWKAAATALVAEGKHMKAIRLYHRALACLPRCRTLWHDVAALTLAYGDSADLENINVECKKFLGENLRLLLKESVEPSGL